MSVDISVSITEDVVDIIATPTVNIVNVTNSASINPGLYDLSQFTNTSINPFVRTSGLSAYVPTTRTISTTSPLTGGGDLSANRTLSIPMATTLVDGYLSAADWTIFNGKQNALGFTPVPTTRTLTINGTTQDLSADRTFTISTGITIGTTAITSGTVGRVLFEGTGNVVQESANLFWDNTNARLGLGTASPSAPLGIVGSTATTGLISITNNFSGQYPNAINILFPNQTASSLQSAAFYVGKALTSKNGYGFNYIHSADTSNANRGSIAFYGVDNILNWFASGNVTINTTTDAGFKLDVNGTARFTGNVSLGSPNINDKLEVYGNILIRANDRIRLAGTTDGNTSIYAASSVNTTINVKDNGSGTFDVTFGTLGVQQRMFRVNGCDVGVGSVVIGKNSTNIASAVLQVDSLTQGFLPPRMTTAQKNAIASPAEGLQVWDTTLKLMFVYNGTTWISL